MPTVVVDTSALVSLGTVAAAEPSPLARLLADYDVVLPEQVVAELRETASYADEQASAAQAVLDRTDEFDVRTVTLDTTFPLDDGENAAVTLANGMDADILLCDEFNQLGLVHASLNGPQLVTTPKLLAVLVRRERLSADAARSLLDTMRDTRSWTGNRYVERARDALD